MILFYLRDWHKSNIKSSFNMMLFLIPYLQFYYNECTVYVEILFYLSH